MEQNPFIVMIDNTLNHYQPMLNAPGTLTSEQLEEICAKLYHKVDPSKKSIDEMLDDIFNI